MALIQVNRATLGNKRLKPVTSFAYAAKVPACEIVASEFSAVATSYPIFFIEKEGAYNAVVLMGLQEGENLFVEADGGWSGGYLPATLRRYPFVEQVQDGAVQLLIDDQCGLLSDSEGEPLFGTDEKSDLASPVGRVLQTISGLQAQAMPTRALLAKIAETGIIQPITLSVDQNLVKAPLGGLRAVNEAAFSALADDVFLELRRSGALNLIYPHLVSMGQVNVLKNRNRFRAALAGMQKGNA